MMEVLRRKRHQTVVLDEVGLIVKPLEDFTFYGGGKGGGVQYIPMQQEPTEYTPPPAPPAEELEATMEMAEETPDEMENRKQATKLGAKSLRIPIGSQNIN